MKADILKLLLQSHADGDESSFRKAALQLAAVESTSGHVRAAEEIRATIGKMPAASTRKPGPVVDIAAPRGELADLLEGGHRDERLRDIVLRPHARETLLRAVLLDIASSDLDYWTTFGRSSMRSPTVRSERSAWTLRRPGPTPPGASLEHPLDQLNVDGFGHVRVEAGG